MKIRSKLMAATAMLLISAIMMTTASFAWFTISTAPEVKGLDTKVVVNENLEIALAKDGMAPGKPADGDSGNYYTWGNLVDLGHAASLAGIAYDAFIEDVVLRPVAATATGFTAPTYGADGRINDLDGIKVEEQNAATYGFGLLVDENKDDYVYGYYVDIWMRSNVGGTVTLAAAGTARAGTTTPEQAGAGSVVTDTNDDTVKGAINVSMKVIGTAAADGGAVTVNNSGYSVSTNTTGTLTNTNVLTLAKDTRTLVRVYIFLDGEKVFNEDASITGNDKIGIVNLQFALAGVTDSMDVDVIEKIPDGK